MADDDRPKAFFISPIGAETSVERQRSDEILELIVRPELKDLGVDIWRHDEKNEPNRITESMVQGIVHRSSLKRSGRLSCCG